MKRLLHISDTHFGISNRIQRRIFKKIISICRDKFIDFLLISGDFLEKGYKNEDIDFINSEFNRLDRKVKVVIIPGNKDYKFLNKIRFSEKVKILYPGHNILINKFCFYSLKDLSKINEIKKRKINDNGNRIILSHGIYKSSDIKKLKSIPIRYIALGHLHDFKKLDNHCCYSGSPFDSLKFKSKYHYILLVKFHKKKIKIEKIKMQNASVFH